MSILDTGIIYTICDINLSFNTTNSKSRILTVLRKTTKWMDMSHVTLKLSKYIFRTIIYKCILLSAQC